MRPVLSRWPSISAVELKRRWTSSSRPISREKNATVFRAEERLIFFAILRTIAVFPIDGRAATIIRFPFWKPFVNASNLANPVASPVISSWFWYFLVISSKVCWTASPTGVKPFTFCSLATWRIARSASSTISSTVFSSVYAASAISPAVSIRRRSFAFPDTISTWRSIPFVVITCSGSSLTYIMPPTSSRRPMRRSSSVTVRISALFPARDKFRTA